MPDLHTYFVTTVEYYSDYSASAIIGTKYKETGFVTLNFVTQNVDYYICENRSELGRWDKLHEKNIIPSIFLEKSAYLRHTACNALEKS